MKLSEIRNIAASKLGIANLNEMQNAMLSDQVSSTRDVLLLSPTGSGKTLAFLSHLLWLMAPASPHVKAVIIAPSRELAIQTYNIAQKIAVGYKVVCLYGGHRVEDEKNSLSICPDVVVSTPGRLVDHLKRHHIDVKNAKYLVLDEFDKALELGFQDEMEYIVKAMRGVTHKVLTSATEMDVLPAFVKVSNPITLSYLNDTKPSNKELNLLCVNSEEKDKLPTLIGLLKGLPRGSKSIVFVNYRESVERIVNALRDERISTCAYHGALEQAMRQKALAMFHNGSYAVMVTTDLGARGLDIEGVTAIIHYHLPINEEAFIHRNGRTARMFRSGSAFVILGPQESAPEYMHFNAEHTVTPASQATHDEVAAANATLYFMAGKREKISKGDIVGFITNNTQLSASDIGRIDVFDHYCLVAVPAAGVNQLIATLNQYKIKNKKVKISIAKSEL